MNSSKFIIFGILISFCFNAVPLLGGWGEMEYYNKNITEVVPICSEELEKDGYYPESYNFYPIVIFTQIVNGINYRVLLAVQDAKSTNLRLFDFILHSNPLSSSLNESTVINTTVLVETLNRTVGTQEVVKQLHDNLRAENMVIQLTDEDYLDSLKINGWLDNSINYSDCTIIKTMMTMGITKIVTFDNDFEKINGFNVISKI